MDMNSYIKKVYNDLDFLSKQSEEIFMSMNSIEEKIKECTSDLTIYDCFFCVTAGIIGGLIASAEGIKKYLQKIHDIANTQDNKGDFLQKTLGKIFYHGGDDIDSLINGEFIKRDGSISGDLHRLYYGHDILSIKKDNPFYLSIKQYGIIKGILQTFRHLIADTFSKTGLPLPGSSYFDYNTDQGLKNLFHVLAIEIKRDSSTTLSHQEVYGELFSLKMQHILSQGLTWALITVYINLKNIESETKKSELKLIGYTSNFLTGMVVNYAKYKIPLFNWPTFALMIKEFVKLLKLTKQEIEKLTTITDEIVAKNLEIEKEVFTKGKNLISYEKPECYFEEIEKGYINLFELSKVLE